MGTTSAHWHPSWWNEEVHGAAWDLVKESIRRDWEQTKHDVGLGGEDLHQSVADTLKQAAGGAPLPGDGDANPPLSLGEWHQIEAPYGYGVAAHQELGARHPQWNPTLEAMLKDEWTAAHDQAGREWRAIVSLVRRGYELNSTQEKTDEPPDNAAPVR